MSATTVGTDEQMELTLLPEYDQDGQPVMIQAGEHYEMRVNQITGQIYSELVPVMEQKMRE